MARSMVSTCGSDSLVNINSVASRPRSSSARKCSKGAGNLVVAIREKQKDASRSDSPCQIQQEFKADVITPMQVLDHDEGFPARALEEKLRQRLEDRAFFLLAFKRRRRARPAYARQVRE